MAPMTDISAILLAAGRSRRMGTQKLLLPFAGTTVVRHVAKQVRAAAGLGPVVAVVGGADASDVAAALARLNLTIVENPDPDGDMLSSLRCGLRALPGECAAAVVALGDQVAVRAAVIDALIASRAAGRGGIIVPAHAGRRGHPVLIPRPYFPELLAGYDGVGLRGLLAAHAHDVYELAVADPGVLADVDTPDDYRRAVAEAGRT